MFIDFAAAFRFALGTPLTASDDRGADEKGPASTARDTVAFFFIRSVLGAGPGGRPDEGAASFCGAAGTNVALPEVLLSMLVIAEDEDEKEEEAGMAELGALTKVEAFCCDDAPVTIDASKAEGGRLVVNGSCSFMPFGICNPATALVVLESLALLLELPPDPDDLPPPPPAPIPGIIPIIK